MAAFLAFLNFDSNSKHFWSLCVTHTTGMQLRW